MGIVKFDSEKHRYYVDDEHYPSVTTILSVIDRSAPLMNWAVRMAVSYIGNNLDRLRGSLNESKAMAILTEAKGEAQRIKQEAADTGTKIHDIIHRLEIKKETIPMDLLEEPVRNGVNAWLKWKKDTGFEGEQGEFIIYSKSHKFAGTVDLLGTIGDKRVMADLKSGGHYSTHFLQLAGYNLAYKEMNPDENIDEHWLIYLDKETGALKTVLLEKTEDIEYLKNVFLAAQKVYQWNKQSNKKGGK